ncbi:SPOR domain-containing protein [Acidithiobacillus sulfurivorans]|uniref:SPOR domain-containing protein n=1 Tax=Acidithiobacillus sulfurivorans TaxID=1958756 RepID=A0ABS6A1B0_9PROT|nr:SPOR domain-containing protein [Acidithiobacillus sulfurivorans]MBU2761185.1 hypothetical protein [Acidithiobacillus sulfurivorans]
MKNTDTVSTPTQVLQSRHNRLGVLLLIVFFLVILLALSFMWKAWSVAVPEKAKMSTSGASSVFLTLPKTVAATGPTVSTAKSLLITSATRSVFSSQITAPSAPSPAKVLAAVPAAVKPVKTPHPCQQAGWYVQLGAFGKVSMAEQLLQQVDKAGVKACVGTLSVNHLFRVLVGPQSSKSEAGSAATGIGKKSGQKGAYPQYWAPE